MWDWRSDPEAPWWVKLRRARLHIDEDRWATIFGPGGPSDPKPEVSGNGRASLQRLNSQHLRLFHDGCDPQL